MRKLLRILPWALGGVAGLTLIAGLGVYLWLLGSLPTTKGELTLAGLQGEVKILRDRDGLVNIRAENELDLYRGLGFVHAQERLWQMDFMRRTASGRLSEVIGETTLDLDRFFRTLGFRQLAEANLDHLSAATRATLEAYAQGVNAFLENRTGPLPLEFQILRYSPEPWTAADSLLWGRLMALRLSDNWRSELSRARLAGRFSPEKISALWPSYPDDGPVTLRGRASLVDKGVAERLSTLLPPWLEPTGASNAWTLGGSRTTSGKPILANDPHLSLESPGVWMLARLEAPGITLAGATAPGVPFLVLGHNERLAWGFTTTQSDTQDFFIERLMADDPDRYESPEGPLAFGSRDEVIRVRDGDAVRLIVRSTRHGPVMSDVIPASSAETGAVLALSWPALREDDRTADALYGINHARNWGEFRAALRQFHSPQQNILYADVDGNIGFVAPARVPIRRAGNGQHPVPGWNGEFDWIGFVPFDELPSVINPRSDLVINANNKMVPDSYPHLIAVDWPPPYRAERIAAALAGRGPHHDVTASVILQQDIVASGAKKILPRLLSVPPNSARGVMAISMLRSWDLRMHRNAPEPLIIQAWVWALGREILADELGGNYRDFLNGGLYTVERLIDEESSWCDNTDTEPVETCDAQIAASLDIALDLLSDRFGDDMNHWRWGEAHATKFSHPVLSRIPVINRLFAQNVESDGGDDTVNRASARLGGPEDSLFENVHGAGFRAVYDLADLDLSRFMIATGQSGNPLSSLYGSLSYRWRDGLNVSLAPETWAVAEQLKLLPKRE
ncbi:penicillin acylase family protein [Pelagibius litoralis]|uniref:Penicillin acylase family protein n=1 Tax=Pelagibius litoralis TaxID=374515 RepID=A0A967C5R1_9PROT|nr:penicillin acylase family protein [Pelagibius litoralis]NIA67017.1 penicillin acylase family protein [Pelagibius litoralis]